MRRPSLLCLVLVLGLAAGCVPFAARQRVTIPADIFNAPPPTQASRMWKSAEAKEKAGHWAEAIKLYQQISRFFINNAIAPKAMRRWARIEMDQDHPEKALKILDEAIRRYPQWHERPQAQLDRLEALWKKGHRKTAIKEAMKLWESSHETPSIQVPLTALLASFAMEQGDINTALDWFVTGYNLTRSPEDRKLLNRRVLTILPHLDESTVARRLGPDRSGPLLPFLLLRKAQLEIAQHPNDPKVRKELLSLLVTYPHHPVQKEVEKILKQQRLQDLAPLHPERIGVLLPLTGPHAAFGMRALRGLALGIERWQEKHSVEKRTLVVLDTGGNPDRASAAFLKLVQKEGVAAILGPVSPRCTRRLTPAADRWGVPILAFTPGESEKEVSPFVFHAFVDNEDMIQQLVAYCRDVLDYTRFAILYPDDPYGKTMAGLFRSSVTSSGGTILASIGYPPESTDFKNPIETLLARTHQDPKTSEPSPIQGLFVPDRAQTVALLAPQLPFYNVVGPVLLGTNLWEDKTFVTIGGAYVENALFPSALPAASSTPSGRWTRFGEQYQAIYDESPDYLSAQALDALDMVLYALDSLPRPFTRIQLRQVVSSIQWNGVLGTAQFDTSGRLHRNYPIVQVEQGRMVQRWPPLADTVLPQP